VEALALILAEWRGIEAVARAAVQALEGVEQ
jgi:hypothetical protein